MRYGMSINEENILPCKQVETLRGAKIKATRYYYDRSSSDVLKIWSLGKNTKLLAIKPPLSLWRNYETNQTA